ncbi:uncharacterized protein SCHCODRAFT_02753965 [Schizophyllum commune H4-8]|nr:uncharacterized protein SCHCODRAFT_02753965 [Schizophyllum commune H4-8]KAI5884903.1 hypothetical protein SCHCODRAFT_02753965 [Schizophyllum commune H4-8]
MPHGRRDEPALPIRRSARIQAQQNVSQTTIENRTPQLKRRTRALPEINTDSGNAEGDRCHKRNLKAKSDDEGSSSVHQKIAALSPHEDIDTTTAKPKGKCAKRCVRFADGEPLAPVTDDVAPDEASAKAAAAAVTIEYLASRPNESWSNIKEMPIPPEALPHLEPAITRDRKGRLLARYSIRYALVFSFDVEALHRHLQRRRPKYRRLDLSLAMHALVAELQSELGIKFGDGIAYSTVDDKLVYTFFMSKSNRPETLPYPVARIRKFQEIINHPITPLIVANRPRAHRVRR